MGRAANSFTVTAEYIPIHYVSCRPEETFDCPLILIILLLTLASCSRPARPFVLIKGLLEPCADARRFALRSQKAQIQDSHATILFFDGGPSSLRAGVP